MISSSNRLSFPHALVPFFGLLLAVLLLASPRVVAAQATGTVVGSVLDSSTRQPLAGAQVHLPARALGALANAQGRFVIPNVPVGTYEIRAELIGRAPASASVTVVAGQNVEVNLLLESRAISLEGVVVTGVAAATPRTQLPFTVEQVVVAPAMVAASLNAGTMLQGRMPGAKVIQGHAQPGEAPSIQLRGPTSITQSQEPLIIVDGVVSRGNLADIDPNDIESIEVVKGAAAASLYGSRAQAGVIEITTRRGADLREGSTEFSVRSTYQKNSVEHVIPMSLSHEYRMTPDGSALVDRAGNPVALPASGRSAFALDDGGNGTNPWKAFQDKPYPSNIFVGNPYRELMRPGGMYSTYMSISGNSGNTQYRLSGRYQRDEGIVAFHDGARQTNFRANLDQRMSDKLTISLSSYLTNLKQDITVDTNGGGIFGQIDEYSAASNFHTLDPDGELALIGDPISRGSNPLYRMVWDEATRESQHVMASLDANFAPFSWLSFAGNVSYDRDDRQEKDLVPEGYERIDQPPGQGSLTYRSTLRKDINASVTASLTHSFGDLTTRSRLRWLVEDQFSDFHRVGASQFAVVGVPRLALLTGTPSLDSQEQRIVSEGFFAITALTWRDKYSVDVLGRRDGSSLFGVNERWQNYYRISGAWRMSEEAWWPFALISEFKPRYSRGTAGGRPGFNFQYQTYSVAQGRIVPRVLGNDALKPERTTEQEFGLDAIVADRLRVQANYVRSEVDDQLLQVPNSASLGFESQWQNAGTVSNKTWELSLETSFVERADLLWTGRLNLDRTIQRITKLGVPPYELVNERARIIIKEGEELGTFYGFKWAKNCATDLPSGTDCSLFQMNDDGLLVYVGSGNDYRDGKIKNLWGTVGTHQGRAYEWGTPIRSIEGNEFTRIGSAQPNLNASFQQDLQWRNVGFTLLFDGEFGGMIMNQTRQWGSRTSVASIDQRNKPDELKKPVPYYGATKLYAGNLRNDWFVEKADFIKLRELSVRYTLQQQDLPAFLGVSRATINLTGRNLKTFTNYIGHDPEVGKSTFGGSAAIGRIDEYFYPNYRSFGLDVELVF
jgi:TonB-linked SusC/RagA family outer membrane protein